jgi:hypothetical protein
MNHNLEGVAVYFALDEIIINYGTPFQKEMGFLFLPSLTELLKVHGRIKSFRAMLPDEIFTGDFAS